jgi:hypothetical protein
MITTIGFADLRFSFRNPAAARPFAYDPTPNNRVDISRPAIGRSKQLREADNDFTAFAARLGTISSNCNSARLRSLRCADFDATKLTSVVGHPPESGID